MLLLKKASRRISSLLWELLKIDSLRFYLCKYRWYVLRRRVKILSGYAAGVGATTIPYNLDAFTKGDAVFGAGNRMSLLLYPTAALLRERLDANILIVGPRTEDDIFWAKSLGLRNTRGLDLFSYSHLIDLGDIHDTGLPGRSLDAVLLGWMISYSNDPERVVVECKRILKPGGLLGIGIEVNPAQKLEGVKPPRVNSLNSSDDLMVLVKEHVVFFHDPRLSAPYECALIFQV